MNRSINNSRTAATPRMQAINHFDKTRAIPIAYKTHRDIISPNQYNTFELCYDSIHFDRNDTCMYSPY